MSTFHGTVIHVLQSCTAISVQCYVSMPMHKVVDTVSPANKKVSCCDPLMNA